MSLIAYGLIALAIIGALGGAAYKVRESGKESVRLEWKEAEVAARKREAELSAFAAKALSDERKKRKVVIQERTVEVEKIVDRPVYSNQCFDADGIAVINKAIKGE